MKKKIIQALVSEIDEKILNLEESLMSALESRDNETKSSVGDKYETGRAMVQMEIEKNQAQLNKLKAMRAEILKIDQEKTCTIAEIGAIVETNLNVFFLAVAFGKINLEGRDIYCISMASPFGKQLGGKKIGDQFVFQNKKYKLAKVS